MSGSKLESLHQKLKDSMVKNFGGAPFLPDSILYQILRDTDLDACLLEDGISWVKLPANDRKTIQHGGQKLFALLAILESKCVGLITNFIKADQMMTGSNLDASLPFKHIDDLSDILGNNVLATEFFNAQWSVTAPLFREDRSHRELRKETVLPFIEKTKIGKGVSGQVYKVTLDKRHHCLGPDSGVTDNQVCNTVPIE